LAPNQESEDSQELWELAKKRLQKSWQTDEATAREDTATSLPDEADKVADEASEVLQDKDYTIKITALLLEPERSKALARLMALLSSRGSSEVDTVSEVIALIPTQPDKALWLSLKILRLGSQQAVEMCLAAVREVKHSRKRKIGIRLLSQPLARLWNSIKFG
jgi:hypothetical protein